MGKEALAVPRDKLLKEHYFQGFMPFGEKDFISTIIRNHSYHARGDELENDDSLLQVIPYVWIINPFEKKVLLYKRSINQNKQDGEFVETRYMNKFSGGIGGHIDRDTEEGSDNPVERAMMRELMEEVSMESYPNPRIVGYINDDTDSIGKVHFGIVAIAETTGAVKTKEEEGLSSGEFYSVDEVESMFSSPNNDVENWTKISWPFIRDYVNSLSS